MRESLRSTVAAGRRAARALCTPQGLRGAGLEAAVNVGHLALYPWGVAAEKDRTSVERYGISDLPPVQRGLLIGDVEAAGTPILLVHGMVDNRSIFLRLRRALRRRGFGRVYTVNYSPLTHDVRGAARRLREVVEQVCTETGYERIHVVGHSLGGIIARYYVQRLEGDGRVHTLCTLGSPHGGTRAAWLLPPRIVRQLRPGSSLIRELAEPAPSCRTRFLAFWSDLDQLMSPKGVARIEHADLDARNVLLRGVGHMTLPISGPVVHAIVTALSHLDEEGVTVQAGVTAIDADRPGARSSGRRPVTGTTSPAADGSAASTAQTMQAGHAGRRGAVAPR